MSPDEIRYAMRSFKKVPEANIDRAVRALVDGGAARAIVSSHVGLRGETEHASGCVRVRMASPTGRPSSSVGVESASKLVV